jgi:hypothetical protein
MGKAKTELRVRIEAQRELFLSFHFFLMLIECGSFIKRWRQKILVSIYISDYLGQKSGDFFHKGY